MLHNSITPSQSLISDLENRLSLLQSQELKLKEELSSAKTKLKNSRANHKKAIHTHEQLKIELSSIKPSPLHKSVEELDKRISDAQKALEKEDAEIFQRELEDEENQLNEKIDLLSLQVKQLLSENKSFGQAKQRLNLEIEDLKKMTDFYKEQQKDIQSNSMKSDLHKLYAKYLEKKQELLEFSDFCEKEVSEKIKEEQIIKSDISNKINLARAKQIIAQL
jgi:chromosome segregation ATPase